MAIAAAVVGFLVLGRGDGDDPGGDVTGPTADAQELSVLLSDGFEDNDGGWEDEPQNGITRAPALDEGYRFEITDQAPANAFAVSIGGARGFDVVDQGVSVANTLVEKGGGGLLNSFGVTCRYTGEDGYYFLISSSGRYVIEKLVGGGEPIFLTDAGADNIAIRPGREVNVVQARCVGGEGGSPATITLIVNDTVIETVTDDDPIDSGTGGIAATGQPGLVVDFDNFEFGEFLSPEAQAEAS